METAKDRGDERTSDSPVEWGPGKTPRGRARPLSSRSRTKPQRSCNLCRQRKLRCDRQHPCNNCLRRELGASCTYPAENETTPRVRKHPVSVQDRVQHLEKLLMEMVQGQNGQQSPQASSTCPCATPDPLPSQVQSSRPSIVEDASAVDTDSSPPASDCGMMHCTPSGTNYVSSAHWAAVLDDIAVLKTQTQTQMQTEMQTETQTQTQTQKQTVCPPEPAPNRDSPQLLYGCTKLATKEDLLASIPARPVVDHLVSGYFASFELSPAFLHSHQFLQQYEEFWEHPQTTPVLWLGQLFSMMCLATQFQRYKLVSDTMSAGSSFAERDRQLQRSAESLRTNIVQCLLLADYIKGGPGVVETLVFYFFTELFFHRDAEVGVWVLLGTIVQLAMRMGYHRDPKYFPSVTPFAGEMQRRVWATIVEADIALAMQMSLPRLIHPSQTDTEEPLNLEDCDFGPATTEMPPSRPEIDQTPILFRLAKARVFNVIGCIWDLTIRSRPSSYAETDDMDSQLQHAYAAIPECFKWRSKIQCMADSPQMFVQKIILQIIYHTARIILRRKYFSNSTKNVPPQQRLYSQKECLDASLKLLDFQHILHEKMEPFGQLYQHRWKVHSLVNHIFLLAASILCFYLQQVRSDDDDSTAAMEETVRTSLRQSRDIWVHSGAFSKEAQKAARAVSIVLEAQPGGQGVRNATTGETPSSNAPSFSPPASAASAASSDFLAMDSLRPCMNDWTEMAVPFSALNSVTWESWSAIPADTVPETASVTLQTPTSSISDVCFPPLAWTG